ncbi:hypothetical protein [Lysobacter enzymogenes]|uniref:DUF2059 domain-containing protein n=1 Tax=Lysobacter enzymogenes TaxID=69 RepID=A0AAU9AFG1_LYSEN|nr:hypothetical protein [Lysobacter enzymogenes]BAV96010.1 hypothetical protein LEN_0523 [Lysobacter enzymogenes]
MNKTHRIALALALAAGFASPAWAANPMDKVGIEHNAYLGCLMADEGKMPTLKRLVDRCGYRPEGSVDDFIRTYEPFMPKDTTSTYRERLAPYRAQFTAAEYAFVDRIDAALSPQAQSPEEIDKALAELETQALAQLGDKSTGARAILGSLSTARHSLEYWTPYYSAREPGNAAARWPKWLKVVVRVVASVVADAATAALVGSFPATAPAAGPAAGVASGAVSGALQDWQNAE